jgi:hypothetical protein
MDLERGARRDVVTPDRWYQSFDFWGGERYTLGRRLFKIRAQ